MRPNVRPTGGGDAPLVATPRRAARATGALLPSARAGAARQGAVRHGPPPWPTELEVEGREEAQAASAAPWLRRANLLPSVLSRPSRLLTVQEIARELITPEEATTLLRSALGGRPRKPRFQALEPTLPETGPAPT